MRMGIEFSWSGLLSICDGGISTTIQRVGSRRYFCALAGTSTHSYSRRLRGEIEPKTYEQCRPVVNYTTLLNSYAYKIEVRNFLPHLHPKCHLGSTNNCQRFSRCCCLYLSKSVPELPPHCCKTVNQVRNSYTRNPGGRRMDHIYGPSPEQTTYRPR